MFSLKIYNYSVSIFLKGRGYHTCIGPSVGYTTALLPMSIGASTVDRLSQLETVSGHEPVNSAPDNWYQMTMNYALKVEGS